MSQAHGHTSPSPSAPTAAAGPFGEAIVVATPVVACDGGGGPLGHPRVFLKFGHEREIVCPYCSRQFVLAPDAPAAGH